MQAPPKAQILLQVAGGALIGGACLWLSLRGVRPAAVTGQLSQISLPLLLAALAGVVLVAAAKALRWQWLFPLEVSAPRWPSIFGVLMTAQMLNILVPIRLGEVARLGLLRQTGIPVGTTLGTIVVEKSLDLLAVGLVAALAVPLLILPQELRPAAGGSALVIALGLLGVLLLIGILRPALTRFLLRLPAPRRPFWQRWQRNVLRLAHTTLDSIAVLEGPHLARVLLVTAGIWVLSAAVMAAILAAFRLPVHAGMALALMLALTSSNWIPTPPALVGVAGAITVAVLAPFGVSHETGLAVGTVVNVVLVAPPVVLGSIAAWLRLVNLSRSPRRSSWRHALGLAPEQQRPPEPGASSERGS